MVLRGRALVSAAARDGAFDGRLWSYLTDVPQAIPAVTPKAAEDLTVIAKASRYLLCQTEELRCFLEGSIAAACGKSVLFPPVLPALDIHRDPERTVAPPRHPAEARLHREVRAPVEHAGDDAAARPAGRRGASPPRCTWSATRCTTTRATPATSGGCGPRSARSATPAVPGVIWHGGQPRAEAMRLAAAGDIGLSWRHPELDASLELSTKVLEFGQLGLPVILNRTPMHEALLGADYPLFAAVLDDVADVAAARAADPAVFALAASRTSAAAGSFALDQAAERLRGVPGAGRGPAAARRSAASAQARPRAPPLRVVIAGHDLKFFTPLIRVLQAPAGPGGPGRPVGGARRARRGVSKELAEWADVVICEWCGPNAVWYSRHKRRDARLLVHLHRFELYSHYPGQVKIGNVDQVICVSDHYAQLTREHTGWPAAKVVSVPNPLDVLPARPAEAGRRAVPPRHDQHRAVAQAPRPGAWTCSRSCAATTTGTCST